MEISLKRLLKQQLKSPSNLGFTIIELLVVVVIIGILATIAAPSWINFVNQRRVNAANDEVWRALQEAKSKAKQTKLSYSVSFRTVDEIPQIAVHPVVDNVEDISEGSWQAGNLGNKLGLESGQVTIGTNIDSINRATNDVSYELENENDIKTIIFDHLGGLPDEPQHDLETNGLIITVARPGDDYDSPVPSSRKCVKVITVLGSLQTGEEDECE